VQRLGEYWLDETSTAYTGTIAKNWAVVRTYRPDNSFNETRFPIRFLILNEAYSRYGAGWIVAGVKRLWEYPEGVLMHEGDGQLRFFLKSCGTTTCSYVTPAGDFSKLVKNHTTGTWSRTYPDGSQVAFSAQGLMTSGTDAAGHTTTIEWQNTQDGTFTPVLSRIVDPLGLPTTFEYDASWYLKSFTIPGNRTVNVTMNSAKQISAISGPVNLSLSYTGRLLTSYTTKYGTTDPGVTTDVAYDDASKLRSVTAAAVRVNGLYTRPQTTFRSVESIVVPKDYWVPGKQLTVDNRATEVNSDKVFGEATDPEGHTTKFVFDGYGNPTKVVDAAGRVTTSRYNAHGRLESFISTNEATNNIWDRNGNLLQTLTNGKVVYEASYGPDGRPVFEMNGKDARWYEYGTRGEVARTWYGKRDDYNRTATRYEYNSRYQLTATIDPKGLKTEWSYDNNSWKNPDYVRSWRDDGSYADTSFTYDTASRLHKVTNPLGETSTTEYDSADRPTRVLDALGRPTTYEYTGGHLTKVTDTAAKAYTFSYNALGWLESEGFPDGGTRTYTYDRDGLTRTTTNRRGLVASQTYDAIHRRLTMTADGATTSFTYTGNHTTAVTNNESVVTTKTVERVGNLDSVSATLGGKRFEIKNIYDGADGLRYVGFDLNTYVGDTYVDNSNKKMRFVVDFRPTNVAVGATYSLTDLTGRITTVQMDTAGRPAQTTLPNGLTQSHSFRNDGRLSGISFSTATVNQKLGATFAWDRLNRLNTRTSANEDRYWSYAYDSVGQVTRYGGYINPPQDCTTITTCRPTKIREEIYTYDAAGNRTDRAGAIVSGTNRYSSFNGYSFDYDLDGNVTRKYKTGYDQRFTWNTLGQLTGVTTNGVTVTYGYDGLGRRVRRTENGQSRYFLYNGDDLLLETDGNGEPLRMYTHWPGVDNPHSVRVTSGGVNATYYYVTEHPGHVSGLVNEAGTVISEYRYTPWGEVESVSDSIGQPLRYMAREIDTTTGLYYVRARWYDPAMARFNSQDPIGLAGGMNTYAYVGNDPVNRRDPSGLMFGQDPVVLPTIYITWSVSAAMYYVSYDANSIARLFNSGEPAAADERHLAIPVGEPDASKRAATRAAVDCAVNAFEADGQIGAFWTKTHKRGWFGYSLNVDLGSLHAGFRQGRLDAWVTAGVYGDITYGGVTLPVGVKVEYGRDRRTDATKFSVRKGAEQPTADVPFAQGAGRFAGGTATFKAGQWASCWVAAGGPN
jgi:RHS repeat-associated protein